jgi:hypothetical protein
MNGTGHLPPRLACAIAGHDWDILVFDAGAGILECTECGETYRSPHPRVPDEGLHRRLRPILGAGERLAGLSGPADERDSSGEPR